MTTEPDASELTMQSFNWTHLPPHVRSLAQPFSIIAQQIVAALPANADRAEALRKLLAARDCAVDAKLAAALTPSP